MFMRLATGLSTLQITLNQKLVKKYTHGLTARFMPWPLFSSTASSQRVATSLVVKKTQRDSTP
jgi:glutamine synthetase